MHLFVGNVYPQTSVLYIEQESQGSNQKENMSLFPSLTREHM